jgi:hypothetical protein
MLHVSLFTSTVQHVPMFQHRLLASFQSTPSPRAGQLVMKGDAVTTHLTPCMSVFVCLLLLLPPLFSIYPSLQIVNSGTVQYNACLKLEHDPSTTAVAACMHRDPDQCVMCGVTRVSNFTIFKVVLHDSPLSSMVTQTSHISCVSPCLPAAAAYLLHLLLSDYRGT